MELCWYHECVCVCGWMDVCVYVCVCVGGEKSKVQAVVEPANTCRMRCVVLLPGEGDAHNPHVGEEDRHTSSERCKRH